MTTAAQLLIVDDEDIALRNLQHVMTKEGYAVTATRSGTKALALLEQQRFDVVLTDLRMEKVDGMDILRRCRDIDPQAEVILITGHASTESAVAAMKRGAFYYLAKPFRLDAKMPRCESNSTILRNRFASSPVTPQWNACLNWRGRLRRRTARY